MQIVKGYFKLMRLEKIKNKVADGGKCANAQRQKPQFDNLKEPPI